MKEIHKLKSNVNLIEKKKGGVKLTLTGIELLSFSFKISYHMTYIIGRI